MTALYRALGWALAPLLAIAAWLHPRLRPSARERLGLGVPEVEPGAVVVHAASLGEGRAAASLVAALRAVAPGLRLVRTYTSEVARAQPTGADQVLALPLDAPPFVAAFLDRLRPRAVLLVEAELWPALVAGCRARGIAVARVAPRAGAGEARLRAAGAWAALAEALPVVGAGAELKSGAPAPPAALTFARPAIVAGSTREGEEAIVLDAVAAIQPRPVLVLAPREPARWDGVAALLEARGVTWTRRSTLRSPAVPAGIDVVLLDSVGELAGLYGGAAAAFVGGTFSPGVGGHSGAEARGAGCPVVRGPGVDGQLGQAWLDGSIVVARPEDLGRALAAAMAGGRLGPVRGDAEAVALALAPVLAGPVPAERALRPWLWPLAPAWWAAVALATRAPSRPAPIPVVSVGGLAAGGSGKTPVAAYLAERLAHRAPVVVARGHGRRRGEDARLEGEATDLGDELAMLSRRGLRVASAPDRLLGVEAAARAGAGVAILDDALQRSDVARDLEVVAIDARWPGAGGPIPVGARRVPWPWLRRADVAWINHAHHLPGGRLPAVIEAHLRPGAVVVHARHRPVGWLRRGRRIPLDAIPARPAVALAGIARPEGFLELLRELGVRVERTFLFADHHRFSWHDLQAIETWLDDHVLVTTEKDAARLPADSAAFALVVELEILRGAEELDHCLGRLR